MTFAVLTAPDGAVSAAYADASGRAVLVSTPRRAVLLGAGLRPAMG